MNVTLYRFSKVENSTKIPSASDPLVSYECVLKDSSSVVNPVLEFTFPAAVSNPADFNYARIAAFKRYYFIEDWTYYRGVWIATLHVDVLGSFRDEILANDAYILRSVFKKGQTGLCFDPEVVDSTYPATAGPATYIANSQNNPLHYYYNPQTGGYDASTGCYIVGIINDASIEGAVTYYCFTAVNFASFMSELFSSTNWMNISDISADLQKAIINPFMYVVSCIWLPFVPSDYVENTRQIKIGWWSLPGYSFQLANAGKKEDFLTQVAIPQHPDIARGNYLNLKPYSFYTLKYYPFGTIDIDNNSIVGYNTLDLYVDVDVVTGEGILTISVYGKENPIRQVIANVGVPVPTAQIAVDFSKIGTNTVVAAGAAAVGSLAASPQMLGNIISDAKASVKSGWRKFTSWLKGGDSAETEAPASSTGALKSTVTNIVDAATSAAATVEIHNQQGSKSGYRSQNLSLSGKFLPVLPENVWAKGRPYCRYETIGDMSGYIQADSMLWAVNATDRENEAIRSYLLGGCFIE